MSKIISNIITFNKVIFEDVEHDKIVFENKVIWQREPDFYIEYETTTGTQYQEFATGEELRQFIMDNKTTFINHCKVVAKLPEITDCFEMFGSCSATTLDLSSFNTSNVTDMGSMFAYSQVNTLDLSSFDTSKVTTMPAMFYNCQANTLDLSSFDTSSVTSMFMMFTYSQATSLDLSSFDTSKVTTMSNIFGSCSATTGYARTQADADIFNDSSNKPVGLLFTVKLPTLRHIEVGDDLSGKTIYCNFPFEDYINSDIGSWDYPGYFTFVETDQEYLIEYSTVYQGGFQEQVVTRRDDPFFWGDLFSFTQGWTDYWVNETSYVLPVDFGIATTVNVDSPVYQYIKIEG